MVLLSTLNLYEDIKLAEKVPNLVYVHFKPLQSTVFKMLKRNAHLVIDVPHIFHVYSSSMSSEPIFHFWFHVYYIIQIKKRQRLKMCKPSLQFN